MRYVSMLGRLGVQPGDTVALSGINCAEHAAIDSAIGLVGATIIPQSLGLPPILTIMALAKRISKKIVQL